MTDAVSEGRIARKYFHALEYRQARSGGNA
jgi:hypothetical protein